MRDKGLNLERVIDCGDSADMSSILIVDDSATMRRMILESLRPLREAHFKEAASGLEALECLAVGVVDLIVLDLNMPDMHGLEVVEFVRKHATFRHIPIIVLTTRGDDDSRTKALAVGATLYLTKPFHPADLAKSALSLLDPDVH
jgi:two-component system chemotaxis response regulator CheY